MHQIQQLRHSYNQPIKHEAWLDFLNKDIVTKVKVKVT